MSRSRPTQEEGKDSRNSTAKVQDWQVGALWAQGSTAALEGVRGMMLGGGWGQSVKATTPGAGAHRGCSPPGPFSTLLCLGRLAPTGCLTPAPLSSGFWLN